MMCLHVITRKLLTNFICICFGNVVDDNNESEEEITIFMNEKPTLLLTC